MKHLFLLLAAAAALLFSACSTPTVTNTARSSVEEMLLSAVVERGVSSVDFEAYAGKTVGIFVPACFALSTRPIHINNIPTKQECRKAFRKDRV